MEPTAWRQEWHLPALLATHLIRPLEFAAFIQDLVRNGTWTFVECGRLGGIRRIIQHIVHPLCPCRPDVPGQPAEKDPLGAALLIHPGVGGNASEG
jgi:hypothetical protein